MDAQSDEDRLDLDVLDAVAGLIAELLARGERVAQAFNVPSFFIKALHMIDGPLAMKDLGRRMHCDPSFVTGIADMLEKRGLAVRESDPGDRRVKRLVLTPAGADSWAGSDVPGCRSGEVRVMGSMIHRPEVIRCI